MHDILRNVFYMTGAGFWAIVAALVAYVVIGEWLIWGFINSVSYHIWYAKTERDFKVTWTYLLRIVFGTFRFAGHRFDGRSQFFAMNGGRWRSAFDFDYSYSSRVAKMRLRDTITDDRREHDDAHD